MIEKAGLFTLILESLKKTSMSIEMFLDEWKKSSVFGERDYKILDDFFESGQVLYLLSYKANILVNEAEKTIERIKFFQTREQGTTDTDGINLSGDNYVCQQILNQLEADFFKDHNDFIDGEARKKTSS